jgi:hypothetical protein
MDRLCTWTGGRVGAPVLASLGLVIAMALGSAASAQCSNDCGIGNVAEGEICLTDFDIDTTNGGCSLVTPVFTDILCNDVVCGIASTFDDGTSRDLDWYRISQADLDDASGGTGIVTINASVVAEFDHDILITDLGDPVCVNSVVLDTNTAAGAPQLCNAVPTTVSAAIIAADHPQGIAIVVRPNTTETVAVCNDNDAYILDVECIPAPQVCDGSAPHDCGVPNFGVPGCNDPVCCFYVCETDPSCCDTPGWVQGCVDLAEQLCDLVCINDCGVGFLSEREDCIEDGGADATNAGCNVVPPLFTLITCTETLCGVTSTFDGGTARDLDWYRIPQVDLIAGSGGTGVLTLNAGMTAEFDHNIWIVGLGVCTPEDPGIILDFNTELGVPLTCNFIPTQVTALIVAADHPNGVAIVVGPKDYDTPVVCRQNDAYIVEVSCTPENAACDGSAPHACDEANPGVPGCNDPECCLGVCEVDPSCCATSWEQSCASLAAVLCEFLPEPCGSLSELHCQMVTLGGSGGVTDDNFIGVASDDAFGVVAADNFRTEESGDITMACWWGWYDTGASDCSATAVDDFTVTYYHGDPDGLPQLPAIASYPVVATRTAEDFLRTLQDPVGENYDVQLYKFSATHPAVSVVEDQCYWIEVRNNLDGNCAWFWETGAHGGDFADDYCLQDDLTGYDMTDGLDIELAWCIDVLLSDVKGCGPPPPNEDCDPPGSFVLTQNDDPNTIDPLDGSIACRVEDSYTLENWYARSYDLSDPVYGVADQFVDVTCVRFASQSNDGFAYPVTVNVYEDTDGGAPTNPGIDLNLLGSKVVWVPVGARGFLTAVFDEPVRVVANRTLVVELEAPNRDPLDNPPGVADAGGFFPGTNPIATTDSFIRSASCAAPNYVPISSLCGACDLSQLLQTVHLEIATCPCDCESPPDGTVDVGDFLAILAAWGASGPCDCEDPPDGAVDVGDFLALLAAWGPCP